MRTRPNTLLQVQHIHVHVFTAHVHINLHVHAQLLHVSTTVYKCTYMYKCTSRLVLQNKGVYSLHSQQPQLAVQSPNEIIYYV